MLGRVCACLHAPQPLLAGRLACWPQLGLAGVCVVFLRPNRPAAPPQQGPPAA
jgi:hypothetical protein